MVSEEHLENLVEVISELVEAEQVDQAIGLLSTRHPADQADLLEELDGDVRDQLIPLLDPEQTADIFEHLDEEVRSEIAARMPVATLVQVLDRVDDDVETDIVQDLPRDQAEVLLPLLEDRETVARLLQYPEDSAGGLMSPDVLRLQANWTMDETIAFLRRQHPDSEQPYYLYVVAADGRLQGIVSLRQLIASPSESRLEDIMSREVISVRAEADREEAAERMRHYDLLALPVVDSESRLLGVITSDDVLDVQVEEATEDMFRMAGLDESASIFRPIREAAPPRLGWLLVNLITASIAALTVSLFEGTIQKVASLAIFMPMVAGMGGNAGIQTITLVVRSLALGEISTRDAMPVIRHEGALALIKGLIIGLIAGLLAAVWQDSAWLGVVVGVAMLANIANATIVGVLVPLTLKALRADPALGSGIFVTTFSDAIGFLVFLGLASLLVSRLT
jgi:magnesium transporter